MDQMCVTKYPSVENILSEESTSSEESTQSEESTPSEENTPSEETATFKYDFVLLEALYKPILDELILDAIWNVCFEVHRAAQHEIYKERKNLDGHGMDSSGKKTKNQTFNITCPKCGKSTAAIKYTSHLDDCFAGRGRPCFRAAKNKIAVVCNNDEQEEPIVEKSKKGRKKQGKKTKPSNREQSSSKPNLTLEDLKGMSYEKREEFLSKYCGTISQKKKTLCKKTQNCKNHNDEARRDIRFLLGISADKTTNDEQIDVDTVDEGNNANFVNWI